MVKAFTGFHSFLGVLFDKPRNEVFSVHRNIFPDREAEINETLLYFR